MKFLIVLYEQFLMSYEQFLVPYEQFPIVYSLPFIQVLLFLTWWGHDPLSYGDYSYPPSLEAVGWFISCLPITAISLGVVIRFGLTQGPFSRVIILTVNL